MTIARFVDPIEASMAKNCLDEAGLPAFLADADTVATVWTFSNALGGIKLQVAGLDADTARAILGERHDVSADDAAELIREAIATRPAPEDGGDDLPPDDDDDPDEPEPSRREKNAERALRAAVFGIFFFPIAFYASFLLMKVVFSDEPLADAPTKRAYTAAAINLPFLVILYLFGSYFIGI